MNFLKLFVVKGLSPLSARRGVGGEAIQAGKGIHNDSRKLIMNNINAGTFQTFILLQKNISV